MGYTSIAFVLGSWYIHVRRLCGLMCLVKSQVKVNGFGAAVAAHTGYRTGLLFSANDTHSPPDQNYANQQNALLLAAMEPFVAKVRIFTKLEILISREILEGKSRRSLV